MAGLRKIEPWNLAEVHLRDLPQPYVEITYGGITKSVRSWQLWTLIEEGRKNMAAEKMAQFEREGKTP